MTGDNKLIEAFIPAEPPTLDDVRHQKFVDNLILLKGQKADAYLAAGFKVKSKAVAAANAHRLLKNAKVQQFLLYRLEQIRDREQVEVRQARIIRELNRLAFSDLRDVIQWDGAGRISLTPSELLTPDQAAAVKKVKVRQSLRRSDDGDEIIDQQIEVELHDKKGPLEVLSRIAKLVDGAKQPAAVHINLNLGGPADGGDRRKPRTFEG